ncbi:MAG: thioredoxin family protein [Armatimonadetes bacterium]|nr:thioredoxin family protein [Armatimonadota bacterium]
MKWSAKLSRDDVRPGEHAQLLLTAVTAEGWHIYDALREGDWTKTTFTLAEGSAWKADGPPVQPKPTTKFDEGFQVNVDTFEGTVVFALPVTLDTAATGSGSLKVSAKSQACDARSCDSPKTVELEVPYTVATGTVRPEYAAALTGLPPQPGLKSATPAAKPSSAAPEDATTASVKKAKESGLLAYLGLAFSAGLLALLTPCVWPMVPITVSFFSKKKDDAPSGNLKGALWYCAGIMGTFTLLGLVTTLIFGASGIQRLAANPWVNLGMGVLFVVLALNLFGVFEIVVPQKFVNKAQQGTKAGGILGPVLMGLTFSLTSFTCTVPFVGALLVSAATGDIVWPVLGMLAFSLAFALPFFFLALFPGYLAKLPRSGSWLVSVKAYMGFLELAAALKFFSNIDVTVAKQPLGLLPQEVFLSVWATIFVLASLYLFGWIHLATDPGEVKAGLPRRLFAFANVAMALYLLAAIGGKANLGPLSGFLPAYQVGKSGVALSWHEKIAPAETEAKESNKLVFVNFTGQTCTNCRVMEKNVIPRADVSGLLKDFARAELYTDREFEEDRANAKLREELTKTSTNPVYVIMTPDRKVLGVWGGLASPDEFLAFIKKAKGAAN